MATSIDERVVEMKFNNGNFNSNAQATMSMLDKLKDKLNFDKARQGLDALKGAGDKFNLSGMQGAVEGLASKFDTLRVIGVTALATLASQAVQFGQQIVQKALQPITAGFQEYNTNMNSIQTVLANTSAKGTNLQQVNDALNELNTYSDKTIYNFSEMARNVGTFTAAGVDLNTSVTAIKGISNLAATSGSSAEQASTAMYQLSQAIASGSVKLQDWNSVVNAGMGGEVFQEALKRTARAHGIAVDAMIKKDGSFRESLQEGWITSQVLTETLSTFTGDLSREQIKAMGYTDEQTDAIMKQAASAVEAATVVKTLPALIGTLAESAGSGWTKTFQLLFGDFEQAKTLFTGINNVLGPMINASAKARNDLLQGWSDIGGRAAVLTGLQNIFTALMSVVKAVGAAFREVFPPVTAQQLLTFSKAFEDFTKKLIPGKETVEKIKSSFQGFFVILGIGWDIFKGLLGIVGRIFSAFSGGGGGVLDFTSKLGDGLIAVKAWLDDGNKLNEFFNTLGDIILAPIHAIVWLGQVLWGAAGAVVGFIGGFTGFDLSGLADAFGRIGDRLSSLAALGPPLTKAFQKVIDFFKMVGQWMAPGVKLIGDAAAQVWDAIKDAFATGDYKKVLDVVNTGLLAGFVLMFRNFFKGFKKLFGGKGGEGGGIGDAIKGIFGGVTETFETMQQTLKSKTLITIAIAIGILTASVIALSLIDSQRLTAALIAIGAMMGQLTGSLAIFSKFALGPGMAKLPIVAAGLVIMAGAIFILSLAVSELAKMDWGQLARGLTGLVVILGALIGTVQGLRGAGGSMITIGVGIAAMSLGIKILASALKDFAELSWDEILRGLTALGSVLGSVIIFNKLASANKGAAISAINIVLLGTALKLFASAVTDFSGLDLGAMTQGLIGVGTTLGLLILFTRTAGNAKGMIQTAVSLTILGAALKIMASAVNDFGSLDTGTLVKGLLGMAGALLVIVLAMGAMPANMIVQAAALVVVGAALKIIASAMADFGGMSWDEIGKGFTVLAGSLILLAAAMYAMEAALPGAAALIVAAGALAILAPAVVLLGQLTWGEIGAGIGALGIALAILAVGGVALIPAIPGLLALGVAVGLIGFGVGIAAAGIGLLAIGLVALGTAGPLAATGLTAMVTAILDLIPLAIEKFGEGIVAFATVIGSSGPTMVQAMLTLLLSLLTAIATATPQIISTLVGLLDQLISALANNVPRWGQQGLNMLVALLNVFAANVGRLVTAGTNIVVAFITGIGNNAGRVTDAAGDTIVKFVNGLATSINTHASDLRDAGKKLAVAIADGLTGGLASKVGDVARKAADMASSAVDAAKNLLHINSPSKVFHQIGVYSGEGFENGIASKVDDVASSSKSMANTAVSAMREAIAYISDAATSEIDSSPTIRPILDLSAVRSSAGDIGQMFTGVQSIKTNVAYASAVDADAGVLQNRTQEAAPTTAGSGDVNVKLYQTNNSPKALPASEIYRNTKNALSAAKEELKV